MQDKIETREAAKAADSCCRRRRHRRCLELLLLLNCCGGRRRRWRRCRRRRGRRRPSSDLQNQQLLQLQLLNSHSVATHCAQNSHRCCESSYSCWVCVWQHQHKQQLLFAPQTVVIADSEPCCWVGNFDAQVLVLVQKVITEFHIG